MASRSKKVSKAVPFSASDLQSVTKANPYVQRLIEDPQLRENLQTAYDRLLSAKNPQKAVLEDKKFHNQVSSAAEAVRDAALALNEAPKRSKPKTKRKRGRGLLLLIVGAGAAVVASESLRSKVLDALFGSEEEFEYTPPTPPSTTEPASPVSAA